MHFGLRGRQEHDDMMVDYFSIEKDDDAVEFITFSEGPTKTRQGGFRVKPRLATPKMFAIGEKRCPVALFKQYLEKRPEKNEGDRAILRSFYQQAFLQVFPFVIKTSNRMRPEGQNGVYQTFLDFEKPKALQVL